MIVVTLGLTDALDLLQLHQLVAPAGLHVAALQGNRPALVDALTHHYTADPSRPLHLIGYNEAGIGSSRSWLKRVAGHWLRSHPDAQVYVSTQLVSQLTTSALNDAIQAKVRPVTGGEAGLTNPTWQDPPPHRAHLLICQGPRCLAKGGKDVADNLWGYLQGEGIADDCLITLTGCLYPCNRAPVVAVQPAQRWLHADPEDLATTAKTIAQLCVSQPQPAY